MATMVTINDTEYGLAYLSINLMVFIIANLTSEHHQPENLLEITTDQLGWVTQDIP
jgi:hypothetical protein